MTSISKTINAAFLRRLQGLNPATKNVNPARAALSGSSVSISDTLRFGARTFATSVQRLNVAIGGVNVVQSGLESLQGLVERMQDLAQESARGSTGKSARRRLNAQFQQLGEDFKDIVSELNGQSVEYLTKEGLRDVFLQAGLDPDESEGIAELFAQFVGEGTEGLLAADTVQPQGVVKFRPLSTGDQAPNQVSEGQGAAATQVTAVGSLFTSPDSAVFTGSNGANISLLSAAYSGSVRSLQESLSSDVQLVGASANSGSSLISSSENFQGYNTGGFDQLFVVDGSLNVVSQLTNNVSADINIESAAISKDGLVTITRELDVNSGLSAVVLYERSSIEQDPTTVQRTVLATGQSVSAFEPVISDDGKYTAFSNDSGGVEFIDLATKISNPFLSSSTDIESVGFTANSELAVLRAVGNGVKQIERFDYTDASFTDTLVTGLTAVSSNSFATLQGGSDALGYIAYQDNSDQVVVVNKAGAEEVTFDFTGASISSLSLAPRGSSSNVVVGALAQFAGDVQAESYVARQGETEGSTLPRFAALFDGEANLLSRRAAVQVGAQLATLNERIATNIKALENAREVIGQNLTLVRASGFAFLDISEEVSGSEEAEQVASLLARRIREDAKGALAQAENLELMVVAALTSDGELAS